MGIPSTYMRHISVSWRFMLASLLVGIASFVPSLSLAQQADTPMGDVLCTVGTWLTGNAGKGIVTIAIIIIGIGCLTGKVSWGMAAVVMANVAVVFSAGAIVDAMGASSPSVACNINVAGSNGSDFIPADQSGGGNGNGSGSGSGSGSVNGGNLSGGSYIHEMIMRLIP